MPEEEEVAEVKEWAEIQDPVLKKKYYEKLYITVSVIYFTVSMISVRVLIPSFLIRQFYWDQTVFTVFFIPIQFQTYGLLSNAAEHISMALDEL